MIAQAAGGSARMTHAVPVGVRAEHVVRVAVLAPDEPVEFSGGHAHASASSSRRMPATGIATQSGRLSSSYWSS